MKAFGKKLAVILLFLAVSCAGAFATLGDGKKNTTPAKPLLSNKVSSKPGSFTLRSGYNFRGSQVINTKEEKYISIRTVMTYQQGRNTYVLPVQKKVSVNLGSDAQNGNRSAATVKFKL